MKCRMCPRLCGSERTEAENNGGFCNMSLSPRVARAALHHWEEPCISGTNGSGTIFFSGCSLKCVYCQNEKISSGGFGRDITVEQLAELFRSLEAQGAHNINLVTPTHFALPIMRALDIYRPNIPIVYNSSGYENVQTLRLLSDYIDIYLMDYKYISPPRAHSLSSAEDYPNTARQALLEAYRQKPTCTFENGIMKSGVIVRHLLLPQATGEAMAVFDFVKREMPNAFFSLMAQYTPCGNVEKPLNRKITRREYDKVFDYIAESGFENCFVQELESSGEEYIPSFNLEGI